jgi:hypothetical protein
MQETVQGAASAVAERAQDAWDTTRGAASSVAETATDAWDEAVRFMRRYPVATFCAGLALGVLLASAFRAVPGDSGMIRGMEKSGRDPLHPYGT